MIISERCGDAATERGFSSVRIFKDHFHEPGAGWSELRDGQRDLIGSCQCIASRTIGAIEVNGICDRVGFDFVQLHGSETVAYCHTIDRPIIKAFKVWNHTEAAELEMAMEAYKDVAEYFLLDTGSATAAGGTGESFDWKVVEDIVVSRPFFLAGGLSPDNVAGAVDRVKPFGLDVSSGVEESPGIKDFGRIDTFIEQARGTVSNR